MGVMSKEVSVLHLNKEVATEAAKLCCTVAGRQQELSCVALALCSLSSFNS